jgi:hypothetical protein
VLVSGYQSIDLHCIVLPVKFDGGLSISVLRNKQLFKKMDVKSSHFQILWKKVHRFSISEADPSALELSLESV